MCGKWAACAKYICFCSRECIRRKIRTRSKFVDGRVVLKEEVITGIDVICQGRIIGRDAHDRCTRLESSDDHCAYLIKSECLPRCGEFLRGLFDHGVERGDILMEL